MKKHSTFLITLFILLCTAVQSKAQDLQQITLTVATTGMSYFSVNATDSKEFLVNWGDGAIDMYKGKGVAWNTEVSCNHTYASKSTFTVTVTSKTADCDLSAFYFYSNDLTQMDVSKATKLLKLYCIGNKLTSLDLTNNTALTELHCGGNEIAVLDVSKNATLQVLECPANKLKTLDVKNNANLYALDCHDNYVTDLKVTRSTLNGLQCYNNSLSLQSLYDLSVAYNGYANLGAQQIDTVYQKTAGEQVDLTKYLLTTGTNTITVVINGRTAVKGTDYTETAGKVTFLSKGTFEVSISNNLILSTLATNIPPRLVVNVLVEPAPKVLSLDIDVINGLYKPFERIIAFAATPNSKIIVDWGDSISNTYTGPMNGSVVNYTKTYTKPGTYKVKITSVGDISSLYCSGLRIKTMDLSQCPAMKEIYCSNNLFTSIDLSACLSLTRFSCPYNLLTTLDVSKNTLLRNLDVSNGTLHSIDLSNNLKLDSVYLYNNAIPLNELYTISKITKSLAVNNLGTQTLETVVVTGNTAIDLTSLATIGSTPTVFTVVKDTTAAGNKVAAFERQNIPTAVNSDYTLENGKLTLITNGTYRVTMTNESVVSNGTTKASVKASYTKTSTTAINDLSSKNLKIYPNPTKNIINIETENSTMPIVKIISIQGNIILQTQSNNIDLSPYEKGIYLLQVNGKTFKVTKN